MLLCLLQLLVMMLCANYVYVSILAGPEGMLPAAACVSCRSKLTRAFEPPDGSVTGRALEAPDACLLGLVWAMLAWQAGQSRLYCIHHGNFSLPYQLWSVWLQMSFSAARSSHCGQSYVPVSDGVSCTASRKVIDQHHCIDLRLNQASWCVPREIQTLEVPGTCCYFLFLTRPPLRMSKDIDII